MKINKDDVNVHLFRSSEGENSGDSEEEIDGDEPMFTSIGSDNMIQN